MATSVLTKSDGDATLTQFHVFPKLPIELRFKIWRDTMIPRVVEMRARRLYRSLWHRFFYEIPILLHVHHESRTEGLRYYELSRQSTRIYRRLAMNRIYFNPTIDTLLVSHYVGRTRFSEIARRDESGIFNTLQTLMAPHTLYGDFFSGMGSLKNFIVCSQPVSTAFLPASRKPLHLCLMEYEEAERQARYHGNMKYFLMGAEDSKKELTDIIERWATSPDTNGRPLPVIKSIFLWKENRRYVSEEQVKQFEIEKKG